MKSKSHIDCTLFRESVSDLLEQALSPVMALRVERHREDCESCRSFLDQLRLTVEALATLGREDRQEELPLPLLEAFRRWRRVTTARRPPGGRPAALLRQLLERPPEERLEAARGEACYRSRALGELVLVEAARLWVSDPERSLELAHLGVAICDRLALQDTQDAGAARDLCARSWVLLGNAKRICSDFVGASQAFQKSEQVLASGSGDPSQRAYLLQVRAQFLAEVGRPSEAVAQLDEAIAIYRAVGDRHQEGRSLICKGKVMGFSGEVAQAIEPLRSGLALIDGERDPRLVLVAKHNLVQYLFESHSREAALKLLPETRKLHQRLSNRVDLVRFGWLEGKIALDLGDLEAAERAFLEVKEFFVEHGIAYDAALVSLDLAAVYLQQARTGELKALAGEMVTIFRALGIRREAFAALAFFNKALEIEQTATMGLLRELVEALETTRQREDFRSHLSVSG